MGGLRDWNRNFGLFADKDLAAPECQRLLWSLEMPLGKCQKLLLHTFDGLMDSHSHHLSRSTSNRPKVVWTGIRVTADHPDAFQRNPQFFCHQQSHGCVGACTDLNGTHRENYCPILIESHGRARAEPSHPPKSTGDTYAQCFSFIGPRQNGETLFHVLLKLYKGFLVSSFGQHLSGGSQ